MTPGIIIFILILLVRGLANLQVSRGTQRASSSRRSKHVLLWWALVCIWVLFAAWTAADVLTRLGITSLQLSSSSSSSPPPTPWSPRPLSEIAMKLAVVAFGLGAFIFPWQILYVLARGGHARLVYWLSQVALISVSSDETVAGSALMTLIALARRGDVTKKEIAWVKSKLSREQHGYGTFGTAHGLLYWIEARVARDVEGDLARAAQLRANGRALLGTVTYCSERAVPPRVLAFVWEILACEDAKRGQFGALEVAPKEGADEHGARSSRLST